MRFLLEVMSGLLLGFYGWLEHWLEFCKRIHSGSKMAAIWRFFRANISERAETRVEIIKSQEKPSKETMADQVMILARLPKSQTLCIRTPYQEELQIVRIFENQQINYVIVQQAIYHLVKNKDNFTDNKSKSSPLQKGKNSNIPSKIDS